MNSSWLDEVILVFYLFLFALNFFLFLFTGFDYFIGIENLLAIKSIHVGCLGKQDKSYTYCYKTRDPFFKQKQTDADKKKIHKRRPCQPDNAQTFLDLFHSK